MPGPSTPNLFPAPTLPAAAPSSPATVPCPAPPDARDPARVTTAAAPGLSLAPAKVVDASLEPVSDPARVRAAADWLRWGRCRGLPSEALLFAALAGTAPRDGDLYGKTLPACRSELYGCLRLTHDLPWTRRGLDPLAAAWPAWGALRRHWDELAAAMAAEIGPTWPDPDRAANGGWWPDCPNTTALLRRVLAQAGVTI